MAMSGFGSDTSGNLTKDPNTPTNGIVYDAENHQKGYTKSGPGGGTTNYSYDGDGHRVKKVAGSITTVFVYNVTGQLIAEYTSDPVPAPQGGGGTSYLTSDHLESTRVVTKADGSVKARYDYLPYGEEIDTAHGGRSLVSGYAASDSTRQKFTQKERDSESGLDYFLARYYSSAQGRFTSPDPWNADADKNNPQSWNGYAYARGNPLKYVDPDGQSVLVVDNAGHIVNELSDEDAKKYLFNKDYQKASGYYTKGDGNIYDAKSDEVIGHYQNLGDDRWSTASRGIFNEVAKQLDSPSAWLKGAFMAGMRYAASPGVRTRINTISGSRTAALAEAKKANSIPVGQHPDRVIKPTVENQAKYGLRPGENVRVYEYTNSSGQKIWIREDRATTYADGGTQGPHFNSGPAGEKLTNHHYWQE